VPVELGASWIHGNGNNPLTVLGRQCGVETVATNHELMALFGPEGQPLAEADARIIKADRGTLSTEITPSSRCHWGC
jgi:hypothetical protein